MPDGQVVENNSATTVAEPVASGQSAPVSNGTLEGQSGQAAGSGQSATAEESFSNIDPKTLSPELQAVYKSLQADYSKKTQSIADVRKKADAYDQVSKDKRFVDYWKGLNQPQKAEFKEQKAEVEKTLGQKFTDEEFQNGFKDKNSYLAMQEKIAQMAFEKSQKQIEKLEQQLSIKEAKDVINDFAMETGKDGKPLRPDFDKMDEDGLINGFVRLSIDPSKGLSSAEYANKLQEGYDFAKRVSQKFYDQGKAEALKIIQAKAASSTEPPTNAAKGAYTGPDPKKMSVRDAMDLAKKGIRVPRDD